MARLEWDDHKHWQLSLATGESTRAPLLSETSVGNAWLVLDTIPSPSAPDGRARILAQFGPNRNLNPEVARTTTARIAFTMSSPLDLSLSANLYRIRVKGRIDSINAPYSAVLQEQAYEEVRLVRSTQNAVELNREAARLLANESNETIIGCAVAQTSNGPCLEDSTSIDAILDLRHLNIAQTLTQGLDVQARMAQVLKPAEALIFTLQGTRIFDFESRATATSPAVERVNTIFFPPSMRLSAGASFEYHSLRLSTAINFVNAYRHNLLVPKVRIGSQTTGELILQYAPKPEAWEVQLAVKNIGGRPPYAASPSHNGFNYDPRNAYAEGASVQLTVEKRWK